MCVKRGLRRGGGGGVTEKEQGPGVGTKDLLISSQD